MAATAACRTPFDRPSCKKLGIGVTTNREDAVKSVLRSDVATEAGSIKGVPYLEGCLQRRRGIRDGGGGTSGERSPGIVRCVGRALYFVFALCRKWS